MMVLFIVPCADAYENNLVAESSQFNKTNNLNDHDHAERQDLCTPFCLCGCCGIVSGIVLQLNTFNIEKIKTFDFSKTKVYYKTILIPRYFGEIWQPPKVNV